MELTLRFCLIVTACAAAVLVVFYVSAIMTGSFAVDNLFNVPNSSSEYSRTFLPFGWHGVFAALPFAIWFYLAIEQLPLAAEETHDVVHDMPNALIWSIVTLLGLSLFTLVLNTGVGGGAAQMGKTDAPLADGFVAVMGSGITGKVLVLIALTGLVASFHSIIHAYGRVIFSLSRAGYFPRGLSVVNRWKSPQRALIIGAVVGLVCAALIRRFQENGVGAALLNMAVFGAVISYALVMVSYVALRVRRPDLPRPYRSPLGIPGAVLGCALSMLACFAVQQYRPGVLGTAIFLVVGMVYYFVFGRMRLVAQAL